MQLGKPMLFPVIDGTCLNLIAFYFSAYRMPKSRNGTLTDRWLIKRVLDEQKGSW